ncbi:MAG TPA: L,D-transpeptidase [Vicinamibacteria bacterium]
MVRFFGHGGHVAWWLIGVGLLVTALSSALFAATGSAKLRRDVTRMVFEDNEDVLEAVRWGASTAEEQLERARGDAQAASPDRPYLVVSIEERRVWYKQDGRVLFEAPVATGSGKTLVRDGGASVWKFETPRGRLVVRSKEESPVWVPPDWHYVEQARKRGLTVAKLDDGGAIPTADGGVITVSGNEVVKRGPDGSVRALQASDGREIVADGKIIVPPTYTSQRRYEGVLGTHRLNLGDGYALHGTNRPETVGQAVSHGCVRLRNEDIARLYELVAVGTPVYIY